MNRLKKILLILLALGIVLIRADKVTPQSKEDTLNAQLEAAKQRATIAQSQLQQAQKDRTALSISIAKLSAETKAQVEAVAVKQVAVAEHTAATAAVAGQEASAQTAVAVQASADAVKAANDAAQAANVANIGSRNLIIVQVFSLLVVIAGFAYKGFEHKWDTAETIRKEGIAESYRLDAAKLAADSNKNQTAKLEQIHTLVNSNLTAALENELDARQTTLTILTEVEESKKAQGIQPTANSPVLIEFTRKKVAELTSQLAERKMLTDLAVAKMTADLKQPA